MSTYNRKSSLDVSEERQQNFRRSQRSQLNDADGNVNGNNNTDDSTKSSLSLPNNGRRFSGSKSPARNRKSKLIEAMAANFEKNSTESQPVKTAISRRSVPNGDAKITPMIVEPADDSSNKNDNDIETTKSPADDKKVGPSGRRGKSQRGKRMLRQKRRSTGVVNKEDLEDIEPTETTEAEESLQKETDVNTQTNEVSPAPNYSSDRLSVSDCVFPSSRVDTSNGGPEIENTPRRKPDRDNDSYVTNLSSEEEYLELKAKLEAAESTITRLRQEIKIMDKELHVLEDENDQLRKDNKMLEDENRTMLRIMRNGQ